MCALCQMFTGTPDAGEKFLYAAYIDPGAGFVFTSIVPMILGIGATFFTTVIFFLRKKIWPVIKRFKIIIFLLLLLIATAIIFTVVRQSIMQKTPEKKVVILGLDGLDPKIVAEGFGEGLLPNLKYLADNGTYTKLQTVMPAQSPVAWASFMTATEPAKNGVFDFIKRDPQTYLADLVFSDPKKNPIGSTPFWEITSKYHIPTTVLFLPDTFPAPQFDGKMISGMGTPDILGTEGSLTLFSTRDYPLDPKWRGRLVRIPDKIDLQTTLEGPKFTVFKDKKVTTIPLQIHKDTGHKKVTITIQNQKIDLRENEFSPWIHLEFSIDLFTKIRGIARFYLKAVSPDLEIYLSPMNFDPENPVYPISSPKGYARELAKNYGLYSTLGLPHDTWALEENIFDDDTFIRNGDDIFNERNKIILGELDKFNGGLFFAYFGITDTMQHMYWRLRDDPKSLYQDTILRYYEKIDAVVGKVLKTLKDKDDLVILSDHGFDRFDYEININTWLVSNGYMVLKNNKDTGAELLADVDWSKTKAYSLGYNGIYLNLKGREGKGIVSPIDRIPLEKELATKLLDITNPETGTKVMKKVYTRDDLGISAGNTMAPDLFLGYYQGIRSSWDTAVGAAPKSLINKRQSKWSGDHLFDPSEIPGVLFLNKKIKTNNPRIIDVIPTALTFLGIPLPSSFDGKSLF